MRHRDHAPSSGQRSVNGKAYGTTASAEYGNFAVERTVADARGLYQSVVGLTADSVMYRNEDKGTEPNNSDAT
eukprot:2053047-Prymnesium_polylepis.1